MAVLVPKAYLPHVQREGRKIDKWSRRKYGISGAALLAKLGKGEGNSAGGRNNPSSAGALGTYQFMPGTRAEVLRQTGADAYGSPAQSTRAARIYVRRGGLLENYNPGGGQAYVDYILGQKVGNVNAGGGSGGRRRAGRSPAAPPGPSGALRGPVSLQDPSTGIGAQEGSQGLAALLAASQLEKPQIPVTPPATPAFSSERFLAMPEGYQAPFAGAPQPKSPGLTELLELARGAQGTEGPDGLPVPEGGADFYPAPKRPARTPRGTRTGTRGRGGGSVRFAPGADRPGARTKPAVKKFVRQVSAIYGEPLTVGTGTRHSQYTVDGNVSQHWDGAAADIPARGKALTRMGQAALIAAGADPKWARRQKGGLYNINGRQIIFNTTQGGDHWDHLHVGV
jgi:hypothetical protein